MLLDSLSASPVWNRELYVDVLIKSISNTIYKDDALYPPSNGTAAYDAARRHTGSDWPSRAHFMAGIERLRNVAELTQRILDQNTEGNLVEGGRVAQGLLHPHNGDFGREPRQQQKSVYLCDSFEGLPSPDIDLYPQDKELDLSHVQDLIMPVVRGNFQFGRRAFGGIDVSTFPVHSQPIVVIGSIR